MEYLLPLGILVGLGLVFLLFRRPTVTQVSDSMPATTNPLPGGDRGKVQIGVRLPNATGASPHVTDEVLRDILNQAEAMPSGTKEGTLRMGNALVHWTMNKQIKEVLRTGTGLEVVGNMPEEARLQYPGSTFIVAHVQKTQSAAGGLENSGGAYKMTLASSAGREQIAAWYREWLVSHGWQPSPFSGTSPAATLDYVRGSEHFRLVLSEPSTVAPVLAIPIPEGTKTVFEVEHNTPTLPSP